MYIKSLEGYEIRIAENSESNDVIKLLKQSAQWMKDHNINQWSYLLEGGDDEEIKQAIADRNTYIVLKDEAIVATFTLLSKQSEWDIHIWGEDHTSNSLYLHRIAVLPSYMGSGLGSRILSWIEANANDYEFIKLDCVSENLKLNNFYKENEFELVDITDNHSKYQKRLK